MPFHPFSPFFPHSFLQTLFIFFSPLFFPLQTMQRRRRFFILATERLIKQKTLQVTTKDAVVPSKPVVWIIVYSRFIDELKIFFFFFQKKNALGLLVQYRKFETLH